MKKLDFNFDPLADLREIAPECFYSFKYPYSFKFDLILNNENYGNLEIIVKERTDISGLKGSARALKKLDEINKKGSSFFYAIPPNGERIIHYPLICVDELAALLGQFCSYGGEDVKFEPNGDFNAILEFLGHFYNPIDTDLLYKKTGERVIIG